MKAEIITIGDEILSGQTLNTNAAFIGEILTKNHIDVNAAVVVGDKEVKNNTVNIRTRDNVVHGEKVVDKFIEEAVGEIRSKKFEV